MRRIFLLFYSLRIQVTWPIRRMHVFRYVTKSYVICYTRPFLRSSSSCEQLLYSRLVDLFSHHLPSHLPAECISIRLFVFTLLLLSVWRIFYPHLFKRFSNKTVSVVAIYPKRLFIVRCPTFFFSKRVQSLGELYIYFNCGNCLAVKNV